MSLDKVHGPDKRYVDWVTRIYSIIRQGYYDLFCLKEIRNYIDRLGEEKKILPDGSMGILRHYTHLLKTDLALCITKAYYDTNRTTMPIYKVAEHLHGYGLTELPDQPDKNEEAYLRIKKIRDTSLAHNGKELADISIDLQELEGMLNKAREDFNKIVFSELGFPYGKLDDAAIYSIEILIKIGVAQLINSSYILVGSDGEHTGKVDDHA